MGQVAPLDIVGRDVVIDIDCLSHNISSQPLDMLTAHSRSQ